MKSKRWKHTWTALAAMLVGLVTPRPAAAATLLPVGGTPTFIHGVNLAWLDGQYDHDIGINPLHPDWGCAYNSAHMDQYLADIHRMKANVVRLWLNENKQGLQLDANGYVTGLDPTFLTNLDNIVSLAAKNGVYLYLTLNGGDSDWVVDTGKRSSYITYAVKPIVSRYRGNTQIFAYDAMNEIEGVVGGADGNGSTGATWDQARSYISDVTSAIHATDPGRLVTSSSGWHNWQNLQKGYFLGLGLDFYDCHQYDDNGYVPDASTLNLDKPVILGEHGQTNNRSSDKIQNTSCTNFINNCVSGNWSGHAIWYYDYPGSTDVNRMLNTDGSWRTVCTTMQQFVYNPPPPPSLPLAPTNLVASTSGQPPKHIALTWTQSTTSPVSGNKVYRSTTGPTGPWTLLTTVSPAGTSYVDGYQGVTTGQTYYYVVTAFNSTGESGYSNSASATAR